MIRCIYTILLIGCQLEPSAEQQSFHSQQDGKHRYLLTHYDVLPETEAGSSELSNPFERDIELTDKELTILRESFRQVGQCVYQVTSDKALDTNDPQVFTQMLNDAQPLTKKKVQLCTKTIAKSGVCQQKPTTHSYVPLDQVLSEMQGVRELYAHRMPWYYDYLAMGLSFVILNGLFDIATHNAQGALIKIADDFINSDTYRLGLDLDKKRQQIIDKFDKEGISLEELSKYNEELAEYDRNKPREKGLKRFLNEINKQGAEERALTIGVEEIEDKNVTMGRGTQTVTDALKLNADSHPLILDMARSEHKAEELFGRFLYIGRETKIFGKTINLNPLWALKEGMGKRLIPVVKEYCTSYVALKLCIPIIVITAGTIIGAVIPFSTIWTGKANSLIHRQQEQRTLDDLLGDWDAVRTFSHVKPEVMSKLENKMSNLATKGVHPCPEAKSLIPHYIDQQTGRFR